VHMLKRQVQRWLWAFWWWESSVLSVDEKWSIVCVCVCVCVCVWAVQKLLVLLRVNEY
jgi:hypothetical protein